MNFPTLYKRSSTGALQEWNIRVEGSTILTSWGQVDGKVQTTPDTVSVGKNLGRSNATSPEEQAAAEAQSRWEKQKKNRGYVETREAALNGEVDALVEGGITPMLAHKYSEFAAKIQWPAFVQPKLDGHRCIAVVSSGSVSLWSRTRKRITSAPHIEQALSVWAAKSGGANVILDGELYAHALHDQFEELSSIIRSKIPRYGHEKLEYHVYDVVSGHEQWQRVEDLLGLEFVHPVHAVPTHHVMAHEDMMAHYEQFIVDGYEGAMIRNANAKYLNRRSYDLQKLKPLEDAEFTVIDVREGRGKMAGHAVFICVCPGGQFDVVMKCPMAERARQWEQRTTFIGKKITVQFLNWTADGLPRGPVGLRIHEEA